MNGQECPFPEKVMRRRPIGHGTTLGGIIVDSGKFDWAKNADKYAPIAKANPSYHGISFAEAVGNAAFITYVRAILLRDTGASISPFNAFLLLQGVETLSLRLDRHAENTKKVIEFLKKLHDDGRGSDDHSSISNYYAGLTGIKIAD